MSVSFVAGQLLPVFFICLIISSLWWCVCVCVCVCVCGCVVCGCVCVCVGGGVLCVVCVSVWVYGVCVCAPRGVYLLATYDSAQSITDLKT